jgi:hypothetical protein
VLVVLIGLGAKAHAQDLKAARADLGAVFRAFAHIPMMPTGPWRTEYYGEAYVTDTRPQACAMQVLAVWFPEPGTSRPRRVELDLRARFPEANVPQEGSALAREKAGRLCDTAPVTRGWFNIDESNPSLAIESAWIASGALRAIAAGETSYLGVDLAPFLGKPSRGWPSPTIEEYSKQPGAADIASSRSASEGPPGLASRVSFGGGPFGGCMVSVLVTFAESVDPGPGVATSARRLSALEFSAVICYIV